MDNKRRIKGKKVSLESKNTQEFFKLRSQKHDQKNPYISVIYQDNDPEIALSRDKHEKQLILPKLKLNFQSKILEIGSGIGRWADAVVGQIQHYVGVDFSEELISQAREKFKQYSGQIEFHICSAEAISPKNIGYGKYFDRIIVSGVLLYLNDEDVVQCFHNLKSLIKKKSILYIREPLSLQQRITLDGVWSEDMSQKYYAIYRNKEELEMLISTGLSKNISLDFKPVYEDDKLNNRQETKQFYDLLELTI